MRRARLLLVLALAGCGGQAQPVVPVAQEVEPQQLAAVSPVPSPPAAVVQRGDGDLAVVPGRTQPSGPGPVTTYVVQVEGGLGLDAAAFAREVDRTLADPRSWSAERAVQRVDDVDEAEIRVTLASPDTTDQLCAPLETGGYFSCANGARAVLNSARWLRGAPSYAGHLEDYRAYVVNHEVGHTLGLGHATCPGKGLPAPVMLQQTKGLDGCTRSAWPYP